MERQRTRRHGPARVSSVLALAALLSACSARDDGKLTWRFAIEETRGSVQDAYAEKFEELIEAKSGGAVDVIVYPYGALGTSDHTTEQLYNQTLEFVMASPGHLGKLMPEVQVFLLHFLFSGDPEVDNVALGDADVRATFDELYREKNFVLLTFFAEGDMVWTTQQEIRSPQDFEGVKIRVMTTPLLLAAYDAYGADPTPLPYAEVYSALQLNMVDGQVNPVFAIQEMSFYEVTEVMTFPGHAQFVTSVMTNAEFYDGLPPEQRAWIDESIEELQPYILDVQQKFNEQRLAIILDKKPDMKIVRFTEAERAPFRERSMVVRDKFVDDVGPSGQLVLDQVLQAVERARASAGEGTERSPGTQ